MPFIEHLEELRWHIVRSFVAVIVLMVVAFLAKPLIFDLLIFGPTTDEFLTYKGLCWFSYKVNLGELFCIKGPKFEFQNLELAGQFMIHLKTSMMLGFVVAFPYIFWEFWRFVKPGLSRNEVGYTRGVVFFSSSLFMIGVLFGYFVLTPFALNFFGSYQVSGVVKNDFDLSNYIGFLTMFVLMSGVIFELPMVVYFLSKLGLLTPQLMRSYRRHAIVGILLISAIITPADIGTQLLVSVPVYFLYEISIFISARVKKGLDKQMA